MDSETMDEIRALVSSELDARFNKITLALWAGVVSFLAAALAVGIQWGSLRTELTHNKEDDARHHDDKDLHMPFEVRQDLFVTRPEFARMEVLLGKIEDRLEKLQQVK